VTAGYRVIVRNDGRVWVFWGLARCDIIIG
jgi:hypothetical protein